MSRQRLGLVMHLYRPDVIDLARQAIEWCNDDFEVVLPSAESELLGLEGLAVDEEKFGPSIDVCLSLGGDGTVLRSCHLVAEHEVPILGVNGGRLGYLAEIEPDQILIALDQWRSNELAIEHRMMLEVCAKTEPDGDAKFVGYAVNEAVVNRLESGRTLEVAASIGGRHFTCLLYTSPSPRDATLSRMPSSA